MAKRPVKLKAKKTVSGKSLKTVGIALGLFSTLGALTVGVVALGGPVQIGVDIDHKVNAVLLNAGFAVTTIDIAGAHQTDMRDIRAVADIDISRHIFDQDLESIRLRVESLPWVKQAAVSRSLPNSLQIDVTEYRPFAIWQNEGRLKLIDRAGYEIIDTRVNAFPNLPLVVGAGAALAADDLARMLSAAPEIAARVKAAIRVGERRWDLKFDNDVVLSLPEEAPEQAWRRFSVLQASAQILEQGYARLDLRLPDMLVVRSENDSHKQKKALKVEQTI